MNYMSFGQSVLQFNEELAGVHLELPDGFKTLNPFQGENALQVKELATTFYNRFYNDNKKRYMVLGSSPARRGTAVTGVPYEDAAHLQKETGIRIDNFHVNKSASNFLYEVMDEFGGCEKFYGNFYMNFVCPLGIVKTNSKGHDVNCNYYDNIQLRKTLRPFIVECLIKQSRFNLDRSICLCIGSGQNYSFLMKLNEEYHFFDQLIPLEHPRFIMQYNSSQKEMYIQKYLNAFNACLCKEGW